MPLGLQKVRLPEFLANWHINVVRLSALCTGRVYPPPQEIFLVDCVWNVMAHAQKPDLVFRRNGLVHLNRQGRQFSRLLATEVCASAVVMLDTPRSEVVKSTGYPHHSPVSPSLPLPCVTVCHHISTGLYSYLLEVVRCVLMLPLKKYEQHFVVADKSKAPRSERSVQEWKWPSVDFACCASYEAVPFGL